MHSWYETYKFERCKSYVLVQFVYAKTLLDLFVIHKLFADFLEMRLINFFLAMLVLNVVIFIDVEPKCDWNVEDSLVWVDYAVKIVKLKFISIAYICKLSWISLNSLMINTKSRESKMLYFKFWTLIVKGYRETLSIKIIKKSFLI